MIHPSAQKILDAIDQYWIEHRYAPSIRDIEDLSYIGPKSNILVHLRRLRSAGLILFDDNVSRSVRTAKMDHIIHRALDPSYRQEE